MNKALLAVAQLWQRKYALKTKFIALGVAFTLVAAHAAQTTATFEVVIRLQPSTGVCTSTNATGTFGASVTVVCGTGTIVPVVRAKVAEYRYLTHISNYKLPTVLDAYSGVGTSTAFRVVSLADREYIEMTVGW